MGGKVAFEAVRLTSWQLPTKLKGIWWTTPLRTSLPVFSSRRTLTWDIYRPTTDENRKQKRARKEKERTEEGNTRVRKGYGGGIYWGVRDR